MTRAGGANQTNCTAMTFAGLANEKQRADVIAYLNTLSKSPLPLPTAQKDGAPAK